MRHPTHRSASCVALLWSVSTCFAQPDTVQGYAAFCYGEIDIKDTDLEDALQSDGGSCEYGTELRTKHEGIFAEDLAPGDPRLLAGKKNFLKRCDTPAWLNLGGIGQCYGATYIRTLKFYKDAARTQRRTDVEGAVLCRHKAHDPALDASGRRKHDDFDDVAMILHNKKSGKTCWFQTEDGSSAKKDGVVRAPHRDPAYWLTPSVTSGVQCARCHDNGPWMSSQWLYSQHPDFKDSRRGKYETPKYGTTAFHNWPPTDDFVHVGSAGLAGTDLPSCTSCHKLAASIKTRIVQWPDGKDNGTYLDWFAYSTGWLDYGGPGTRKEIPQATAYEAGRAPKPGDYLFTHWMPPEGEPRPANATEYRTKYATHLRELKTCMETKQADRKPPSSCKTQPLSLGNPTPAPAGTGAMVAATVVQTGSSYMATAASAPTPPIPQVVAVGHTLRLGWQADSTYEGCTIELTTPPGVVVPAIGGAAAGSIGTGTSWELPEAPPVIGPLTEPGLYDLSIHCDNKHRASLQFQVGTTGPRSLVKLVTSVNQTVQATAIHSHNIMQPATTTGVQNSDSVELTWIAYDVVPNSCTFRGPSAADVVLVDAAGGKTITSSGSADQVFTFQCTGANDSVTRTVSSTLHPADSVAADLLINAAASPNPVGAGSNVTYTLTIANNGPGAAASVTVTDNLPSTTTFVSCAATAGGICGGSGNNRTISFDSLASGASSTISLVAKVNASVANGTLIGNTASVSSSTSDPNTANNSATAVARVFVVSGVPPAPANLTATTPRSNRTRLDWTDNSSNESLFLIEHSLDGASFKQIAAVGANITTFTFTLPTMTGRTTHHYRVRAYGAAGFSPYSNRVTVTMPLSPAAPGNLRATALLSNRTRLNWTDNSSNESLFLIEHSLDGVNFKQIAAVGANITTFTFTLSSMTGGTTHHYRVRAYNVIEFSPYSNRATLTMPR